LSELAVTKFRPSLLNVAEEVPLDSTAINRRPDLASQSRVFGALFPHSATTIVAPSGLNDALTELPSPWNVRDSTPLFASQILTGSDLMAVAVTNLDPSGLNRADRTGIVCPLRVRTTAPFVAS
jgi:hypothetical protein